MTVTRPQRPKPIPNFFTGENIPTPPNDPLAHATVWNDYGNSKRKPTPPKDTEVMEVLIRVLPPKKPRYSNSWTPRPSPAE
jgi:hypothetical protein